MKKLLAVVLMMTLIATPVKAKAATNEDEIKVPVIVTEEDVNNLTKDDLVAVTFEPNEKYSKSYKVSLKEGAIVSTIALADGNEAGVSACYFILDDDDDPSTTPDYKHYNNESGSENIIVPEDGDYYVRYQISRKNLDDGETYVYGALLYNATCKDKVAKNKVSMISFVPDSDYVMYYKVVCKQCSLLDLKFEFDTTIGDSLTTTLCNSKKKEISEDIHLTNYNDEESISTQYVLGKGTYYIKVTSDSKGFHALTPTMTKTTPTGGSSFAKAKAIKFNQATKGILPVTQGKPSTYYYKFTLTKSKSFKINFSGYTADKIQFKIMDSDKKRVVSTGYADTKAFDFDFTTFGSWPKGTYYIVVSSGDKAKQGNGEFSIKIK